jgi:uncharacterized membrane protein
MERKSIAAVLILIVVVGAGLRLATAPSSSVWLDEANSITGASQGLCGIVQYMRTRENGPPLFQYLLHFWMGIFGDGDLACAFLPLIFSVLTPLFVFLLGRELFGPVAGLWAAFLMGVNAISIEEATNVRHNSLLVLLTVLSFLAFFKLVRQGRMFPWYVILCVVGMYEHYYFAFVILSQCVVSIIYFRRSMIRVLVAAVIAGIAFSPWVPIAVIQARNGSNSWYPLVGNVRMLGKFIFDATINDSGVFAQRDIPAASNPTISFLLALPLLLVVVVALLKGRHWESEGKLIGSLAIAYSLCAWLPIVISMARPIYVPHRYGIIGLPLIVLIFSWAFSRLEGRRLVCLIVLFYSINAAAFMFRDLSPHVYNDKSSAKKLSAILGPDDVIVYIGQSKLVTDYYLGQYGAALGRSFAYPLQVEEHPCWIDRALLMKNVDALGDEARAIAEGVVGAGPSRVYLFCPSGDWFPRSLSLPMLREMDERFTYEKTLQLDGFFYDEIRVYRMARDARNGGSV